MKVESGANGKKVVKMSKKEWLEIGEKNEWTKKAFGPVWEIKVIFEMPVGPDDEKPQHEGDADIDFQNRAKIKLRDMLNKVVAENPGMHFNVTTIRKAIG